MTCLLIKILLLSFSVTGLSFMWNYVLSPGQMLERLGNWFFSLGSIGKPLGACMMCNCLWMSVITGAVSVYLSSTLWYLCMIPISFLSTLIINKYIYE